MLLLSSMHSHVTLFRTLKTRHSPAQPDMKLKQTSEDYQFRRLKAEIRIYRLPKSSGSLQGGFYTEIVGASYPTGGTNQSKPVIGVRWSEIPFSRPY